ncbi:MAG: hypothetical protein QOJ04_6833 [Caballeronia sp.]|jgi:hypothetical protein|nr:hypothetical protein [Caballeronia sp.]
MLKLMLNFLEKLDIPKIVEFQRNRNNRKAAAQLFLGLSVAYNIIEVAEILLDELEAALESHQRIDGTDRFDLNLHRMRALLRAQSDNLERLDALFGALYAEFRLLSPEFERTYSQMFAGKYGALMDAQMLLADARLPIHEDHPFPPTDEFERPYRTLWFSLGGDADADRDHIRRYLHGDCGIPKIVIDVRPDDGEPFFRELDRYFTEENPRQLLTRMKESAGHYGAALEQRLTLADVLAEIGSVHSRGNWGRQYLERNTRARDKTDDTVQPE